MKKSYRPAWALLALFAVAPATLGQQWEVAEGGRGCDGEGWSDHDRYCETRSTVFSSAGSIAVDGAANGGIRVEAWDRSEVHLEARVQVWRKSTDEAQALARQIEVRTDGGSIRAEGPKVSGRGGWAVSYRLKVPRYSDLDLRTDNGGIRVDGVHGQLRLDAKNGGIKLAEVGGDVEGRTRNGGLSVELDGHEWSGERLDVRTTNGGVKLSIPEDYSAELVTGTVNGGMRVDFPITVQGELSKRIETTLGSGGSPVRVTTTNGGVVIRRK